MSALTLYDTLSRTKELFTPLDPNNIRLYVCGPTVYDRAHLGNARSVVVYDVLYRLLTALYPKVTYVRNITDVDDKINAAAKANGEPISALTQRVTGWFHEDMSALNCLPPTSEPRATEHIPQMVAMIEKLIANGNAYVAEGHVLFAVGTMKDYGKLSGRVQEELESGARVKVESYKKNPNDFVLWKPADAGDDPSSVFESPWGKGRPGWHIECSAMSTEYLGDTFDLHGGGADLMFPHHENEIAQSCCANPGSDFAKTWVHNGFLTVNGEKMSKSLGNFITVRDLLDKGVKGEVIRYALMKTKYREPLDWSEKLVADAKKELDGFYRKLTPHPNPLPQGEREKKNTSPLMGEVARSAGEGDFLAVLCDDMNIPKALSMLHAADASQLKILGGLLGILQQDPKEWAQGKTGISAQGQFGNAPQAATNGFGISAHGIVAGDNTDSNIQSLIDARIAAKAAKNWKEADRIRNELKAQGILLEDRPDGTTDWRRG